MEVELPQPERPRPADELGEAMGKAVDVCHVLAAAVVGGAAVVVADNVRHFPETARTL